MLQESVYCKLVLNSCSIDFVRKGIEAFKPKRGNVMLLSVTEKQFSSIEFILGEAQTKIVDKSSRVIVI